ncbi:ABC-F family ATP-binding cassette domain-containing protein [Patulibacter americanus]|uniref:ABC-F family ATP-binding cassette domain-containing protein n=1 Tax=Patulibacter americanus TaxID=588672 RepID=UPI0003B784C8|nr:ABC-F family ATP-binding cassette domain-containing protein [Patulibacter americanus]
MAPRNLVNLKAVGKGYASRTVLDDVTLGINAGDRIGIVGRNGDGKSTLLKLIAGIEEPDAGAVTRVGGLDLAVIAQGDELDPTRTIRDELVGGRADHEWAGDATFRSVLDGLLGGVEMRRFPNGLDTVIGPLSGGERRRIALAQLLLDTPELLLLDEPTNHLDVEAVNWLARHLAARRGTMVVITHDRWFLDAVCTQTWEVENGTVHQYEGGYAAYVLARAERDRQAAAQDARRRQLLRKELAWLRRGPPARTSKPKFRIDAANELIADEPAVRDGVELLRFSSQRLGDKVLEAEDVSVAYGAKTLLNHATWRLGPGDRVGLVGVNGSGKTTLINVLSGELTPSTGRVDRGSTVRIAHLSQDTAEIPGNLRVLESLEEVRGATQTSAGEEVSAADLCDRFGFRGGRQRTLVKDLSGGERRRLQLMRLLMDEPNVLLLDEPTNDLDIDTLTALEDLLDAWPGTLVVVSHDRYFVERVCDDVHALAPDGTIRHLPGGIDQYLHERRDGDGAQTGGTAGGARSGGSGAATAEAPRPSGAEIRAARKEAGRLERAMEKLDARQTALHEEMAAAASDHGRLRELGDELTALRAEKEDLEARWLEASETAEA